MTRRYWPGAVGDDPVAARKRKAAANVSRACGLALAAIAAGVLYGGWFRSPAPPPVQAPPSASASTPAAVRATSPASVMNLSLRRLGVFTMPGPLSSAGSIQFSPNGKVLLTVTGGGNQSSQVSLWPTATAGPLTDVPAVADGIPASSRSFGSPSFSPDGRSFAVLDYDVGGSNAEVADIWNVAAGQGMSAQIPGNPSQANPADSVVLGPGGLLAGVYSNGTADVANPASGQYVGTLSDRGSASAGPALDMLTFSPGGRTIAATDGYGRIYLWSVAGGRLLTTLTAERLYNDPWSQSLPLPTHDIGALAFSPDSTTVACGTSSGIVRAWDVATGRSIAAFSVDGSNPSGATAVPITTLAFSPDGRALVTAGGASGTLGVWDVSSGRNLATLSVPGGDVASAVFTPAGTLLVATTGNSPADHRIEVWTTGKSLEAIVPGS